MAQKPVPLVAGQLGNNVAFHIDYLPDGHHPVSIEDSPGDPVRAGIFQRPPQGEKLRPRQPDGVQRIHRATSRKFGLLDAFADWIEAQSDAHNLPDLGEGRTSERVAVTSSGYIVTSEDGTCRFQIQIRLEYYQQNGQAQ